MRSGYAPPLIATPAAVVSSAAIDRDVTSVSTTRELGGGGVPGQTAAAAADGSIEWAGATTIDGPAPSPWTRAGQFPPVPGSPVTVAVGTVEAGIYSMLTGVVDNSAAGSDGVVSSTIIDSVDRLHRRITIPAMLHSMPPLEYGGLPRNVGLSSDWVADTLLRRCAYFTTPYMAAGMSGVNVPGQGSMWPERGTVTAAGRYGAGTLSAQFLGSEWGWGIHSADATYTTVGTLRAVDGFTIGLMVSDRHSNLASVTVNEGAGSWALGVRADQSFTLGYNGTVLVSLPAGPTDRVEARISAGSVALVTDDGRSATGNHPAPSAVTTAAVSSVRVQVQPGANIGGLLVADMPHGHFLTFPLNARIFGGTTLSPELLASPRIERRDALDVLTEIANATCRAYWWDEDGTFQWMPGDVLLSRAPQSTLTSRDSLVDLGWSEALGDTYRSVQVDHMMAAVSRSRKPNVPVWQGKGISLESGQEDSEIASPSTDEEWIQTQWSPTTAGSEFMNEHNHGIRSVWGGVLSDDTTTSWAGSLLSTSLKSIGPNAIKYTYSAGDLPAGKSLQLAFPNDETNSALWRRWRNEKLPLLRAYGRVEWVGADESSNGTGPEAASEYQHDGGKWVQGYSGETPGRIASFLTQWLCVPRLKATGVSTVHDPRIQVGDVHRIRDEHAHGIELIILVTRVSQSVSAGKQSMELDFFVISGSPAFMSLGEHDSANAGVSLGAHNSSLVGVTLGEHDENPRHTA